MKNLKRVLSLMMEVLLCFGLFPGSALAAENDYDGYYMAVSVLKKMLTNGIIAPENYRKATVALAEKYRVSRYDI